MLKFKKHKDGDPINEDEPDVRRLAASGAVVASQTIDWILDRETSIDLILGRQ